MKINPEERPKLILLSLGIVAMLCIFCVTVVPRLMPHGPNGGPPVASTPAVTSAPQLAVAPTPSAATNPGAAISGAPETAIPASTANDPFWRPLALSLLPANQNLAPVRKPTTVVSAKTDFRLLPGGIKVASIAPPSLPDVELQGIVQDETAMAVLSVGGQARFMKAGETLEGGWILSRVQTATVVLRQGRREVVLTLGQTMPKEIPPKESLFKEALPEHLDVRKVAETLPPFHATLLP
jgi:hypothetical protein